MLKTRKAVRKEWVKRLRSRKYKKGVGALQEHGRFCCLGVLCEIAVEEKIIPPSHESVFGTTDYDGETGVLPESVRDWAGLRTVSGEYKGSKYGSLVHYNDYGPSPFYKIARLIESEPEGLFKD